MRLCRTATLRPAQEMVALFRDIPEAIAETRELSSRLQFEMKDMAISFPSTRVGDDETMDIHIRAKHIEELNVTAAPTQSHDFH